MNPLDGKIIVMIRSIQFMNIVPQSTFTMMQIMNNIDGEYDLIEFCWGKQHRWNIEWNDIWKCMTEMVCLISMKSVMQNQNETRNQREEQRWSLREYRKIVNELFELKWFDDIDFND
jgi:hypothetical protein